MPEPLDPTRVGHDLLNVAMDLQLRLDLFDMSPELPATLRAELGEMRIRLQRVSALARALQGGRGSVVSEPCAPDLPRSSGATSHPISVLCVDDDDLLVGALERRFAAEPGSWQFTREVDPACVVDTARRLRPSVVLLDAHLTGSHDAMHLVRALVDAVPQSPVCVFTGSMDDSLVRRSHLNGARGFIAKGVTADVLIDGLRQVVRGDTVTILD